MIFEYTIKVSWSLQGYYHNTIFDKENSSYVLRIKDLGYPPMPEMHVLSSDPEILCINASFL